MRKPSAEHIRDSTGGDDRLHMTYFLQGTPCVSKFTLADHLSDSDLAKLYPTYHAEDSCNGAEKL